MSIIDSSAKSNLRRAAENYEIQKEIYEQFQGIERDFADFLIKSGRWRLVN